jgi:hypothetical protein
MRWSVDSRTVPVFAIVPMSSSEREQLASPAMEAARIRAFKKWDATWFERNASAASLCPHQRLGTAANSVNNMLVDNVAFMAWLPKEDRRHGPMCLT